MATRLSTPRTPPAALFGRDAELAAVEAELAAGARLVTLRGPPGVGKSALARAFVARRRRSRQGGSVVIVTLANATTRPEVLTAMARAVGLSPRTADASLLLERIARRLDGAAVTLVLDGIDAVVSVVRGVVDDLLSDVSDVSFLACAQTRSGSSHELVLPLGPLLPHDGAALLKARTAQASPGAAPLSVDVAERLARWAGGLPLAIEIAAGWVATLGADETLAALGEGRLGQDALDRALDASWGLLADGTRHALACLSTLPRVFGLAAARAVTSVSDAELHVAALVSASLLEAQHTAEGTRYAMLDGVHAYADRRAVELGTRDDARERLARYFASAPRPRADLPESWRRLADERDDLARAWEHVMTRMRDVSLSLRLAVVQEPSLASNGPPDLHVRILETTVSAAEALPTKSEADAGALVDLLYARARFSAQRGRHSSAAAVLERGIALARERGDRRRDAWLGAHLSVSLGALGRRAEAEEHLARAAALADDVDDARLEATVENARGAARLRAGDLDTATDAFGWAAAAARRANAIRLEGTAWLGAARAHLARGDVLAAEHALVDARRLFAQASDGFHLARVAVFEATASVRRGDLASAEARLLLAIDDVRLQDDVDGELGARFALLEIARTRGDAPLAASRLRDVVAASKEAEDVAWAERLSLAGAQVDEAYDAPVLTLARDGRSFEADGRAVDFGRRGPLRRLLVALASHRDEAPGRGLSVLALREAGWPGEKMRAESGASRVYMAIKRLRDLGLEALLLTSEEGYFLDPRAKVRWRDG